MKFLITNSVALNGGDESLLLATILGIKSKYPEASVLVLCNDFKASQKYVSFAEFKPDWEYTISRNNFKYFIRSLLNYIGFPFFSNLSRLLSSKEEKEIIQHYKSADVILSSAGGYIHDHYNYEWRLLAYQLALSLNKRLIFFAQSIGPFFEKGKRHHDKLKQVFDKSDKIILREKISKNHLYELGHNNSNVVVTTDVAFSLHKPYKNLYLKKFKLNKTVALAFRSWGDTNSQNKIIENATHLSSYLITEGYKLTFLSTCQGLDEYKNDSLIAKQIINNLEESQRVSCEIDDKKYRVEELISKYSGFDAYIGMRLHGAILSMLGGTPAFNIGYEDKTAGIFDALDYSDNQIWYDTDSIKWIERVRHFLNKLEVNILNLEGKVSKASTLAFTNFNYI